MQNISVSDNQGLKFGHYGNKVIHCRYNTLLSCFQNPANATLLSSSNAINLTHNTRLTSSARCPLSHDMDYDAQFGNDSFDTIGPNGQFWTCRQH